MTDAEDFIDEFLQHEYDPVKAREYYLRTRKLKGRKPAAKVRPKAGTKRVEEDEVPYVNSKTGAKLVDYDGTGSGMATYSDGSVYDGNGWRNNAGANKNARSADEPQNLRGAEARASAALNKWAVAAGRHEDMPPGPAKERAKKSLDLIAKKLEKEIGKFQSADAARMKKQMQSQRRRLAR